VFAFLVAGEAKDVPEDPRLRIVTGDITDASECEKLIDEATAATAWCNMLKRMVDSGNYTNYVCYFGVCVQLCITEREREPKYMEKGTRICTYLHIFAHICT
jgi:hypothetical protein